MKTQLLSLSLFFLSSILHIGLNAQEANSFTNDKDPDGRPRPNTIEFVPNEIIIKYKDGIEVTPEKLLNSSITSKKAGSTAEETKIIKAEKLFPGAQMKKNLRVVKIPQGNDMVIPNLHNIYKIVLEDKKSTGYNPYDLREIIEDLKANPDVEYAEPNYIFSIGDFTPTSPIMDICEAQEWAEQNSANEGAGLVPNDPLYSQQWGIPACNIDDVWLTHTGDTTSVISILDTGVDWFHPDLAPNIWTNTAEIPDNGMDDDGNGFIDDIRGWDFINNDNDPKDDNSHGTHCAGIAAAVGDNGIGIAGVNWKARIMPIKVFQSTGRGDAATISQGIIYASANGANVLSMSFGGYTESITMRNALANAYATSVLVAAAGNDALCIGPGLCPDRQLGAPLYPGAYSFVLGVEAPPNPPLGFTNYDQDGPVFSNYEDLLNYELKAPGIGIISCVPGGSYREYSGTSMAAPLVAGAISLYREIKSDESQELIFGNFINSLNQFIDLEATFNIIPIPKLDIVSYEIIDTIDGDGDGRPDAGETIEFKVKVRNSWGQANDVKVGIEFSEFEDQTTATILANESIVGSVSAYATLENTIPLRIKLDPDIDDGRDIVFYLKTWYGDHLGEKSQTITISIENGVELKGIINNDLTLYPNNQYIITDNIAIPEGVTLTIKPGTKLKFGVGKRMVVAGTVYSIGTRDSLINFTKRDNLLGWGGIETESSSTFYSEYSTFEYMISPSAFINYRWKFQEINNCKFLNNSTSTFIIFSSNIEKSCFYNNKSYNTTIINALNADRKFINNNVIDNFIEQPSLSNCGAFNADRQLGFNFNYGHNNIFSNSNSNSNFSYGVNISSESWAFKVDVLDSIYFGTINENIINSTIIDFQERGVGTWFDISTKMDKPSKLAHGIVWKILVNGKDAQDEFDQLDPAGVGKQKFEVYFNRAMDTLITPLVSMGVRYPYTQTSITEDGSWSADSTIYTVYSTIGLSTGDGINTIRVTGAKDTDHFEIPIEDRRFRVVVSAAGSLSNGFLATPGMGKVNLEWESPDEYVDDLLGYNMYRYTFINDSTTTDTVLISESMVTDTVYTDYEVVPDTKYFYTYKTVRTNLTESSFSKIVAATPYTAAKGDANGDLAVNVSDIISTVSYILMKNPQPFILEAADYNSDGTVNVLDITGIVKKILNPSKKVFSNPNPESVTMFVRGDTLFVDSPVSLGGIQFTVRNTNTTNFEVLDALKSFERATISETDSLFFLAYSMTGKTFGPGIIPILKFNDKFLQIDDIVLSTSNGNSIIIDFVGSNGTSSVTGLRGLNNLKVFPNPFSSETMISYKLSVKADKVVFYVFNTAGIKMDEIVQNDILVRENRFTYRSDLNPGFYILKMSGFTNGRLTMQNSIKLFVK